MATDPGRIDRAEIAADFERARLEFRPMLDAVGPNDCGKPTRGTRWTNEQLLFHMVFGYMVVQRLLLRVGAKLDRVIDSLQRRLAHESDANFRRGMHYATRWDPFFRDDMTREDVYRYPGRHFGFHALPTHAHFHRLTRARPSISVVPTRLAPPCRRLCRLWTALLAVCRNNRHVGRARYETSEMISVR